MTKAKWVATRIVRVSAVLTIASGAALATGNATLNIGCKEAISQAELAAANRKWTPTRADPTSPVVSISTSMNYAKAALLGPVFSHPKIGELTFKDVAGANVCEVKSNGHPADVVLKDLQKKFDGDQPPPTEPPSALEAAQSRLDADSAASAPATSIQPMTNSDVLALVKAGLGAEVITAKIKTSRDAFDTSAAALTELKADGVPESVMLAMVNATQKNPLPEPR
ncbi:MAG: hypothetical protein ACRD1L_08670 [Terriglobales bacterium]